MSDYVEHLISQAGVDGDEDDGETLARCIQTRRRRKCIAAGEHTEGGCQRCGL